MKINKDAVLEIMAEKNIKTQTELAERMNMSKSQLSQMLSPDYEPVKRNVHKLVDVLDCNIETVVVHDVYYSQTRGDTDYQQISFIDFPETANDRFNYKLERFTDVENTAAKKQYNVLETFAGAGGLALGLERASFNTIGAIENDPQATETLRINRPHWNILEKDINIVVDQGIKNIPDFKDIKDLDLLSGGYPCQSFSFAGKGLGFSDTRGTLFYPFSEILNDLQPRMFLAENVRGLENHDSGRTLFTMIQVFKDAGYHVVWNVLNAWDYETAQKRERLFMIGIRNDLKEEESFSYRFPNPVKPGLVLRDVLVSVPESPGVTYSKKKYSVLKQVPPGGCWVDLPEEVAKSYLGGSWNSGGGKRGMARRISWDEPSLTLTTSPSQKQTERCHPDETRPFTIREYARIQGFPDDWQFAGGVGAQYKQIGNAVPVNLAKYVGLSIIKYLNQFE